MKAIYTFLLFVILTVAATSIALAQDFDPQAFCESQCNFSQFTADVETNDIVIANDIAWIATNGGLLKYNLTDDTYIKYTTNNGLRTNLVKDIALAENDIVWLATNLGLCKFNSEENCFYYDDNGGNSLENPYRAYSNQVEVDANNRLWLLSSGYNNQITIYDEANGTIENPYSYADEPFGDENTCRITKDNNGDMWILLTTVTEENGDDDIGYVELVHYDLGNNTYTTKATIDSLGNWHSFCKMEMDANEDIWFSVGRKLYKYDVLNETTSLEMTSTGHWITNLNFTLDVNNEQQLWFSVAYDNELYLNSMEEELSLSERYEWYNGLYVKDNQLWVATSVGVYQKNSTDNTFDQLSLDQNFLANYGTTMEVDGEGNIWIGYRDTDLGMSRFNVNTQTTQHFYEYRGAEDFLMIGEILWFRSSDRLYRSTSAALNAFEEVSIAEQIAWLNSDLLLLNDAIYVAATYLNSEDERVIGLFKYHLTTETMNWVLDLPQEVADITSDGERIFLATDEGVYVVENEELNVLVADIQAKYICWDAINNWLWISRQDVEWNVNHLYTYSDDNGLQIADYVHEGTGKMILDHNNQLWIGRWGLRSANGLGPFYAKDGLPSGEIRDLIVDEFNNLWMVGPGGMAVYEAPNFINTSQNTICFGDSVLFSHNLAADATFNWELTHNDQILFTSEAASFDYLFEEYSGSYNINLNVVTDNGCQKTDVQTIQVNPTVEEIWIPQSYPLCNDTDWVTLQVSDDLAAYQWMYNGEIVGSEYQHITNQPGMYMVNITDHCGGETTLTTEIVPNLSFYIGQTWNDAGEVVTLSANIWDDGTTYLWSTGETTQSIEVSEEGDYSVTVTYNGCTATEITTVSFLIDGLGEEGQNLSNVIVKVYPNPSADFIKVTCNANAFNQRINTSLYSLSGQLMYTQSNAPSKNLHIDMNDFASGVYLLQVQYEGENKMHYQKIVKQ